MLITFSCPTCGKAFHKDESVRGKKAKCGDCGSVFVIPEAARPSSRPASGSTRGDSPEKAISRVASLPQSSGSPPARPRRATPSGPRPSDVDDPYGLEDVPAAPRSAPIFEAENEAEDVLPKRVRPAGWGTTSRRGRRSDAGGFFGGLPSIVYQVVLGVLVGGFLLAMVAPSIGAIVFLGGGFLAFLVLAFYGAVGMLVLPFRESVLQGLLCWLVPFYVLGYLVRRWDEMKGVFLSYLAAVGVLIALAVLMPVVAVTMRGGIPPGAFGPPGFRRGMPEGMPGIPRDFQGQEIKAQRLRNEMEGMAGARPGIRD